MNAGVEINAIYEKFVSVFAFLAALYEKAPGIDAKLPLLSKVSAEKMCRLNSSV